MNIINAQTSNRPEEKKSMFATGLSNLLNHKFHEMTQDRMKRLLGESGLTPQQSETFLHAHKHYPEYSKDLLREFHTQNRQNQQGIASRNEERIQGARSKYGPELGKLEKQEQMLQDMLRLTQSGKVNFGKLRGNLVAAVPGLGNAFASDETGEFDALSNQYVADMTGTGVRSVAALRAQQGAKPSLTRTQSQNEAILRNRLEQNKREREHFLKIHPYLRDEDEAFQQESNNEERPMVAQPTPQINQRPPANGQPTVQREVAQDLAQARQDIQAPRQDAKIALSQARSPQEVEGVLSEEGKQYTTPENAGIVAKLLTWGGQSALLPFEVLPRAVNLLADYINGGGEEVEFPSDRLQKSVESRYGNIEPQGASAEIMKRAIDGLPFVLATSGLSLPAQLLNIAGATGVQAVQGVSDNPLMQASANIFADVLAKRGFGLAANKIASLAGKSSVDIIKNSAHATKNAFKTETQALKEGLYNKSLQAGSEINAPHEYVDDTLTDFLKTARRNYGVNESELRDLTANGKEIMNIVKGESSIVDPRNLNALTEAKKFANSVVRRSDASKEAKNAAKGLVGVIKKTIEKVGESHPEFTQPLKLADEIHQLQNWNYGLKNFVWEKVARSGKVTGLAKGGGLGLMSYLALQGLGKGNVLTGLGTAAGLGFAAKHGVIKPSLFLYKLSKNKEGIEVLSSIVANAAKDSTIGLTRDLANLNKLAAKWYKDKDNL